MSLPWSDSSWKTIKWSSILTKWSRKKNYCVAVQVQQVFEVNDAKDANVKIYDYYQPERVKSVSYNLPFGTKTGINEHMRFF